MLTEALFKAGDKQKASTYADFNGLKQLSEKLEKLQTKQLSEITPFANAAENDHLIGAYMTTGNTSHITSILNNATQTNDTMLHDALRASYMLTKFGNNLTPKESNENGAKALCLKYQCRKNPKNLMQILTISSGFWAVQSLAKSDKGIKDTFISFLKEHKDIEGILKAEGVYFSNYLTMHIVRKAKVDHAGINKFLSAYETFKPIKELNEVLKEMKDQQS